MHTAPPLVGPSQTHSLPLLDPFPPLVRPSPSPCQTQSLPLYGHSPSPYYHATSHISMHCKTLTLYDTTTMISVSKKRNVLV